MVTRAGLLAVIGGWVISVPCLAQGDPNVARENLELRQRLETLEKQVQQLQTTPPAAATAAPAPGPAPATAELGPGKKPFWSTLDIQFYGYIKLDAAWDSSRVTPGDYIIYASEGGEGDDEFNMTARQTRLGLKIKGPDVGNMKTSGLIETDFYGMGGTENKPVFRMRHAYMLLDWPDEQFSILAGQTWDVIAPLYPSTLNFTILWDAGNIGYRHPQVRVTKQFDLSGDMKLELAGALSRTIGDLEDLTEAGARSGFPTLQGRAGLTFPWLAYRPTTAGLSGLWGQEDYSTGTADTWSLNLDVLQPICPVVTVKGEAYIGENLDDYFGGIGQGVRIVDGHANGIGDKGGWIAVTLGPWDPWTFNVGAGIDDVDNEDVDTNDRTSNQSLFANALYAVNKNADIGVELSQWRTGYKDTGAVDDTRIQASFIYKF